MRASSTANSLSSASALAICSLNVSRAKSRRSRWAGRPSTSCSSARRTFLGKLSGSLAAAGPRANAYNFARDSRAASEL